MWVGGQAGLARYDGNGFHLYLPHLEQPTSISGTAVNDLLVDSRGTVWIATTHGLNKYSALSDDFTRYIHDSNNPNSLNSNVFSA